MAIDVAREVRKLATMIVAMLMMMGIKNESLVMKYVSKRLMTATSIKQATAKDMRITLRYISAFFAIVAFAAFFWASAALASFKMASRFLRG